MSRRERGCPRINGLALLSVVVIGVMMGAGFALADEVKRETAIQIAGQYIVKHGYSDSATASTERVEDQKHLQPEQGSLEAAPYKVSDKGGFWSIVYRDKSQSEYGWQVAVEKDGQVIGHPGRVALRPPDVKVSREQAVSIAAAELVRSKMESPEWFSELNVAVRENRSYSADTHKSYADQLKGKSFWSVYFSPFGRTRGGDVEVAVDQNTGEVIFAIGSE